MSKLWSFFWLAVATTIAVVVIASLIEPYIWLIITVFIITVVCIVGLKIYKFFGNHRRHF